MTSRLAMCVFVLLARMQPYLWFGGMALFSASYHIAGIMGMPRRVFSGSLAGAQGAEWHGLTVIAADGGVVLILVAYAYPLMQLISHPRYGSPGFQPF